MNLSKSFAIYSKRTMLPDKTVPATIIVDDGKISSIHLGKKEAANLKFIDVADSVVMPGVIDPHVHINEPGRTEWEGFETATKAAVAGGITTVVDMPLNSSPVTINKKNFIKKTEVAKNKCSANVYYWGGATPQNSNNIGEILSTSVLGIKAFLTHSGIDEFPNVTENDLNKIMPEIAKSGKPLLVHCELDEPNSGQELLKQNPTSYQAWLKSRPKDWENKAIKMMIDLCEKHNCQVHIVHLSSAEAMPLIEDAKRKRLPITVETCPHYLYFSAEDIPDANTKFKCAPPIREKENNKQLFKALQNGLIDFVASDHSPAPPEIKELKSGDFSKAWGGIASLQFSLSLMWTLARKNNLPLEDIRTWLSENPAKLIQMSNSKGKIQVGYDADLVVWNPDEKFIITEDLIKFRHKISPYIGEKLFGKVEKTFVVGDCVFNRK
ncbi:MAG: allantoinase AllB [Calditrichaeota bacterium]|nr:MAG: allantoinase AllB [Calditrichota bacterium]MBL1205053.1 allantoinase AllB [Calditrichota bacterium]NOG44883.1 allantoinase AllB [Calditrichota bacterium]